MDAIEHGWIPSPDHVGQGAKELLQLMSWVARRGALGFVEDIKQNLAAGINE